MATTSALRTVHAVSEAFDAPMMARVHLGYRDVLAVQGATPGLQILCDRCTLWITQDGAMDDVILRPGERFTLAKPGRVVLQGMRQRLACSTGGIDKPRPPR
jgi:hypothetical protein